MGFLSVSVTLADEQALNSWYDRMALHWKAPMMVQVQDRRRLVFTSFSDDKNGYGRVAALLPWLPLRLPVVSAELTHQHSPGEELRWLECKHRPCVAGPVDLVAEADDGLVPEPRGFARPTVTALDSAKLIVIILAAYALHRGLGALLWSAEAATSPLAPLYVLLWAVLAWGVPIVFGLAAVPRAVSWRTREGTILRRT